MNDGETEHPKHRIELCYELDAPPQKVWRAISIPAFRAKWLPDDALADGAAVSVLAGQEISYLMRDHGPPFFESRVTFKIAANAHGGTRLQIIQQLTDARLARMKRDAANNNGTYLMLAA